MDMHGSDRYAISNRLMPGRSLLGLSILVGLYIYAIDLYSRHWSIV